MNIIPIQSGAAFTLKKGEYLKVTDIKGQQVSDIVCFNEHDVREKLSTAKSMDFEETLLLTRDNVLWSNRGNMMIKIIGDTNGRNDVLLAPCSQKTFEIMYGIDTPHPSCFNNLKINLEKFGIASDDIPCAFNAFMNVQFETNGKLHVLPPTSIAGDTIILEAYMDLIIGMTSCSAPDSNGGSFKEIGYEILNKIS